MKRNKWSRTGTEGSGSIDKLLEKIGGGPRGMGARRTSKKAKTNVSKTGKADSTASGADDLARRKKLAKKLGLGWTPDHIDIQVVRGKKPKGIFEKPPKSAERHLAEAKGKKRLAKKKLKADKKSNPSKYVGRTKSGVSRKDRKDYAKLYGDMLPKAEHPYTVKPTQYK